jgi:hypothetical protein
MAEIFACFAHSRIVDYIVLRTVRVGVTAGLLASAPTGPLSLDRSNCAGDHNCGPRVGIRLLPDAYHNVRNPSLTLLKSGIGFHVRVCFISYIHNLAHSNKEMVSLPM